MMNRTITYILDNTKVSDQLFLEHKLGDKKSITPSFSNGCITIGHYNGHFLGVYETKENSGHVGTLPLTIKC